MFPCMFFLCGRVLLRTTCHNHFFISQDVDSFGCQEGSLNNVSHIGFVNVFLVVWIIADKENIVMFSHSITVICVLSHPMVMVVFTVFLYHHLSSEGTVKHILK